MWVVKKSSPRFGGQEREGNSSERKASAVSERHRTSANSMERSRNSEQREHVFLRRMGKSGAPSVIGG